MEQLLPKWQYITHPDENFEDLSWVNKLSQSGIKWIQLRIKETDFFKHHPTKKYDDFFIATGKKLSKICHKNKMLLTINDHVEWVREIDADGAHIGKEDMNVQKARAILGEKAILGATVNSFEDIQRLPCEQIDYFGLGPFAATTTKAKDKLAPIVSLEKYKIMSSAHSKTPIFAIGGIKETNVEAIFQTGVYGIALSGEIFKAEHMVSFIHKHQQIQSI